MADPLTGLARELTLLGHETGWLPEGYQLAFDTTYVKELPVPLNRPAAVLPCPIKTDEYDWGNYCPNDPYGVHHCTLPESHRRPGPPPEATEDVPEPPPTPALHCLCICGTRREPNRGVRQTGVHQAGV